MEEEGDGTSEVGEPATWAENEKGFEIRDTRSPSPPRGAVVIRVSLADVCGSDTHYWKAERGPSRRRGQRGHGGAQAMGVLLTLASFGRSLGADLVR